MKKCFPKKPLNARSGFLLISTSMLLAGIQAHALPAYNDIDVPTGQTQTISDSLTDADGASLNKSGGGTLILTGSNTYSGGTEVVGGTLTLSGSGAVIENNGSAFINTAALNIEQGAFMKSHDGNIGYAEGSVASASVSGSGSIWNVTNALWVGLNGDGTLTITGGGVANASTLHAGKYIGSQGTVLVSGSGSALNLSSNLFLGVQGNASLTVENGATLISNSGRIGDGGTTGTVLITGSGSGWTAGTIFAGISAGGVGDITVSNGASVTSTGTFLGEVSESTGTLTVTGTGSSYSTGDLWVGSNGNGTLNILNGATFDANKLFAGTSSGTVGTVLIDGAGSRLDLLGQATIGNNGNGNLTISNGAVLTSASTAFLASASDASATVLISGSNSRWENNGQIYIGNNGDAELTIEAGGTLTSNGTAFIGAGSSASGIVEVMGLGSAWINDGDLRVGNHGSGSLFITDGATVSNENGIVTASGSANSTWVVVSGAGSRWNNSGDVSVEGMGGPAYLLISDSAVVQIDGNGSPGSGTLTLSGTSYNSAYGSALVIGGFGEPAKAGTLLAERVVTDCGSGGVVAFIHTDRNYTFAADMDGKIGVYSLAGNTHLTGNSNVSEVLVIGGSLFVDNTLKVQGDTDVVGGNLVVTGSMRGSIDIEAGSAFINGYSKGTVENHGGFLGGSGTIRGNVFNHAFFSPGASIGSVGTLEIGKNFTQSENGVFVVDVSRSKADHLIVDREANLAGSLVVNKLKSPKSGTKFEIITADCGIDGTFDSFRYNTNRLSRFEIEYFDNSVVLEYQEDSIADFAGDKKLTSNQKNVARALDRARGRGKLSKVLDSIYDMPLSQISNALAVLSPEELSQIFQIGVATAQIQNSNLAWRLQDAREGATGFSNALSLSNPRGSIYADGTSVDTRNGLTLAGWDGRSVVGKQTVAPVISENRWSFFAIGSGEWADVETTSKAAGGDFTTGGVTIGADYRVNENLVVGIAGGYANTDADLSNGGDLQVNSGRGSVYGTLFGGGFYLNASAGGAYNSYDTKRSTFGGKARGSTEGGEFDAMLGGGYDYCIGGLTVGPIGSLEYTYLDVNGFQEHGSDAPLRISSQNLNSLRSLLGLKASYAFTVGGIVIKPEIRAQWRHEYLDTNASLEAGFVGGTGVFAVEGSEIGRDSVLIDAGATVQVSPTVSVFAYYTGEIGRTNYSSNAVNGGFRISF